MTERLTMNTILVQFNINGNEKNFGIELDKEKAFGNKDIKELYDTLSLAAIRYLERNNISVS
uniref:Uncharacterized protein n=2 Tax=viral metagenome TaxID=1070528 RepID=A0A6H1ZQK2_9ZZZZ